MFAKGIKRFDNLSVTECWLAYIDKCDSDGKLTSAEQEALYYKLKSSSASTGGDMPSTCSWVPAPAVVGGIEILESSRPEYVHRGDVVLRTRESVCKTTCLQAFCAFDRANTGIISPQQFKDALEKIIEDAMINKLEMEAALASIDIVLAEGWVGKYKEVASESRAKMESSKISMQRLAKQLDDA